MNSNQDLENTKNSSDDFDFDDGTSVDDFIRQLEAKEKALDISSDLVIEVGDSEFDDRIVPDFLVTEIPPIVEKKSSAPKFPTAAASSPASSFAGSAPAGGTAAQMKAEIAALKNQISKLEQERTEVFENSRRRQRDFDNYRSRTERERSQTFQNQLSNLATQLLPVLDNMDRALDFAVHVPDDPTNEFRRFFDGIILVNQQLNEILAEMGVMPIAAVGERFDPHRHEAVAVEETEKFAPNTICAELLRGYRIGDKVIRASMVKVATAAKKSAAPSSAPITFKTSRDDDDFPGLETE